MRRRSVTLGFLARLAPLALVPLSCGAEDEAEQAPSAPSVRPTLPESPALAARLAARRGLPRSRATFEQAGNRIVPHGPRRQRAVSLGTAGDRPFELAHTASGVSAHVTLVGASAAEAQAAAGYLIYPGAYQGGDVLLRPTEAGLEDYVVFESAPAEPRVRYVLSLSAGVAGLRLVEGTLELLDAAGAPRVRVSNAHLVGADGRRHEAEIAVSGCAFDRSPVAPWRRPVTPPGARTCTVETRWGDGVTYPAVLDPSWSLTDQMSTSRHSAMAARLPDGAILLAGGVTDFPNEEGGGCSGSTIKSAELFDPVSETWSMTGSLTATHVGSRAALLADGTLLVAGGTTYAPPAPPGQQAELYDPDSGEFTSAGALSAARQGAALVALPDGTALLVGGIISTSVTGTSERFTPPSSWAASGDLDTPRGNITALTLSTGKVLVAGGSDSSNQPLASAELYSPESGEFALTDTMSAADYRFDASELRGQAILVPKTWGGMVQLFDVENETFSNGQPTPSPGNSTAIPGGAVRVNSDTGTTAVYDLATNSWSEVLGAIWGSKRTEPSLLTIDAERVLIAGGTHGAASFELCAFPEAEIWRLAKTDEYCDVGAECASGQCEEHVCLAPEGGAGGASGAGGANGAGGQPGAGGEGAADGAGGANGAAGVNGAGGEGGVSDGTAGQSSGSGANSAGGAPDPTGSGGGPNASGGSGGSGGSGAATGKGGSSDSGGRPNPGSSGASGEAGSGGSAGKSGSADDGGCGCRVGAPPQHGSVGLTLFALALTWLGRRRAQARGAATR